MTQLSATVLSEALCCALLLLGCGGQSERDLVEVFGSAQALDEHVVWVDQGNDRALVLDVSKSHPKPKVKAYDVASNPVTVSRRNGHNELLMLAKGQRSGEGSLSVLGPKAVLREYPLGTRFDQIHQSDDGRYAFVSFNVSSASEDEESLLFNPNEVAIVDLDGDGESAVTNRSLRGFGSAPQKAVFSPVMDIAGEMRRIVVVLFSSHVALLDLNHLDRPEYTVELSSDTGIGLNQVRFSPEEDKIYLLGAQSDDVYVLTLLPASENRANDFEPSLNQLGASARPSDMALYQAGDEFRLLAVSGSQALVIEAGSNRVTPIPLQAPADNILLYEGTAPFDDAVQQRALLYRIGATEITFLDLDQVEERKTRNLEELRLSSGIQTLTPLEDNLVLIMRNDSGLSMLNLEGRSASEISAKVNLSEAIASPELNRLWVRPEGRPAIAYLDFSAERSTPGQVALDEPALDLLLFTKMERKRVVLTHAATGGAVTILNAIDPENKQDAVTLRGFFYSNLFDQE